MSPMRIIILAVAAIAAIGAAFLVRNLAETSGGTDSGTPVERIVEVEVSQMKVLIAQADLPVGTLLTPENFEWADWPEKTVNPNYFTQLTTPEAMEELTGSVVKTALFLGEPILPQKIVQKGETGFMAALLEPGMRALAVEISPESASAGFILPDDRVDVILTQDVELMDGQGMTERTLTTTILQNVRILAIDQTFGDVEGVPTMTGSTATMELTPEQTEVVTLAARTGSLSLTLRSYADANFNNGQALSKPDVFEDVDTVARVMIYKNGTATAGGS
ncbi:MAG: Flp pilus assembly protein CpaB [Henriciella sp.]|nr:Flp pilus assembly protein CpaB [Henriciella sp.]